MWRWRKCSFRAHNSQKFYARAMDYHHCLSLIEMLVVIAIIGIIASMLLPSLVKARNAAVSINCISNLKQSTIGALLYTNDNKDYLLSLKPGAYTWPRTLMQFGYVSSERVLCQCPAEELAYDAFGNIAEGSSYGLHYHATGYSPSDAIRPTRKLLDMKRFGGGGSRPVFLGDSTPKWCGSVQQQEYQGYGLLYGNVFQITGPSNSIAYPLNARHNMNANMSFFDGHAASFSIHAASNVTMWQPRYKSTGVYGMY